MRAAWTPRRLEFNRRLEQLVEEFAADLRFGTATDELDVDDEPVPDSVFIGGWLLTLNWVSHAEDSWTVVAHPQGMMYVSRLGLAHSAVMAIG